MRRSGTLTDAELLARIQNLENLLGVGLVIEPGAATIQPSSASQWNMAPGTAIIFYDTAGIARVRIGALPSGDYGLLVTDPNGMANEIWPISSEYNGTEVFTTSTTPAVVAGTPSVTCYIGASGDALVEFGCDILAPASDIGEVFLAVDGAVPAGTHTICALQTTAGGGQQVTVHGTRRLSDWIGGVTPNENHTFSVELASTSGGSCGFAYMVMKVQPL